MKEGQLMIWVGVTEDWDLSMRPVNMESSSTIFVTLYGQDFAPSGVRLAGGLWQGAFDEVARKERRLVTASKTLLIKPHLAKLGTWIFQVATSPNMCQAVNVPGKLGHIPRYHPIGGIPWSQIIRYAYLPGNWAESKYANLPQHWYERRNPYAPRGWESRHVYLPRNWYRKPAPISKEEFLFDEYTAGRWVENEQHDVRWRRFGLPRPCLMTEEREGGHSRMLWMDFITTAGKLLHRLKSPVVEEEAAQLRDLFHWYPTDNATREFPLRDRGQFGP
ncbi:hypothetical protein CP533_1462 [Ophiocordyceps camponoti-saundersi (nom. inval.)]|nr:hypothetical protein CP533_1462 [Ophiocordyceps camponoti-saundersi (nom. inval.)]